MIDPPAAQRLPAAHPLCRAVVFDLDGTLVDTIELILGSYRHAFADVLGLGWGEGVVPAEAVVRTWIGQPLLRVMHEHFPSRADELSAAFLEWNHAHTADLIRGYDGVTDVLAALAAAGVRVAVATSKLRGAARLCADLGGITPHVQALVAYEDTALHKPHPAPLLEAAARLGVHPSEAAYVGDAVVDVEAAHAAGMTPVAVTWGAASREALQAADPAHVATSAAELHEALLPERPERS